MPRHFIPQFQLTFNWKSQNLKHEELCLYLHQINHKIGLEMSTAFFRSNNSKENILPNENVKSVTSRFSSLYTENHKSYYLSNEK